MGELVPLSSSLQARGGVHPGQVAGPSQGNTETYRTNNHAHTHCTKGQFRETNLPNSHVFGLWEGARVPGARREHAKSMQKDPWPGVEPRTFLLQGNSATNSFPV
ncbi:hypothetical protein CHARACLAT_031064 [Characodon lateralis]|uniref:Uncharacterized protein n=1 Tax=Characodon lateralis TaxID=208331 RepID=A0ABU7ERI7_9TELE|nr:hypothetical protein [Characodon lateralis]